MSKRFLQQASRFLQQASAFRAPDWIASSQHLPGWLADRLLRPGEEVAWVRGPRFNPAWERYVTHPALFFYTAAFGFIFAGLARLIAGEWSEMPWIVALIAAAIAYVTIVVLGVANGYFTRLVATNLRLIILQGYEICRSWKIDDLPPSLLRYGKRGEEEDYSIDWDAVDRMLGGSSDKFTDTKAILSFGKQLDRIMIRDNEHR
jgi:hypothetical protein